MKRGFRRDGEPIHTIVITDEAVFGQVSPSAFVRFYNTLNDDREDLIFSGILAGATEGYVQAINQIGGFDVKVQGADWNIVLREFAQVAVDSAEREELFLTKHPVVEDIYIELYQNGVLIQPPEDDQWYYVDGRNSLLVEGLPEGEYELHVTYPIRSGVVAGPLD